ncbi:MAG: hydrogenase expression/formation protein HypE [Deltaproteobacteria bacterium]|nr:hydrogenase expression/formation protein HypE [Deltaproteobacteria bacterium]
MSKETILIAHGGGGEMTKKLIDEHIVPRLSNPLLDPLTDAAVMEVPRGKICLATDASVVTPLFFPGGDIGRLAVSGTVNDLAVMGADPQALCVSLIIEEGLELAVLDRVLDSIAATAKEAGVPVAAGDTKVVERRGGDGLTISTAGVGVLPEGVDLSLRHIQEGDSIIVTGSIADHGLAVMSVREGLAFETELLSDVTPLTTLARALRNVGAGVRFMRDPTRGGLAGVLVDICEETGLGVEVSEATIPLTLQARHAAEFLGLDPLHVANEGKLVVVCAKEQQEEVLAVCHADAHGEQARVIGRTLAAAPPLVELCTSAGGRRIVRRAYGEELPRIC